MAGVPGRRQSRQKSLLIAELAGLAGTGKTTLSRVLSERDERIIIGPEIELRKVEQMPIFVGNVPHLLPILLRRGRDGDRFAWDQIKAMVYLRAWPGVLRQQAGPNGTMILLDHGPVFKLATLHLVIWLDAPDATLRERIRGREQRHIIKEKSDAEVFQFLARYRASYARILAKLRAKGGPALLAFDTSQASIEQIVDQVLAACSAHRRAQLN
jgi:shikimate kinase